MNSAQPIFKLKCFVGQTDAAFFIQSRGLNSGRPLVEPIPNCFAVYSNLENLFELVYALYKGRCFEPFIHGSVIPMIRIADVKQIIEERIGYINPNTQEYFKLINDIDKLLHVENKKIKTLQQLQYSLCRKVMDCNKPL